MKPPREDYVRVTILAWLDWMRSHWMSLAVPAELLSANRLPPPLIR